MCEPEGFLSHVAKKNEYFNHQIHFYTTKSVEIVSTLIFKCVFNVMISSKIHV